MSSKKSRSNAANLSAISFFAVMLVGLSQLASFILSKLGDGLLTTVASICQSIGLALAILVPVILSYGWAKNSKKWVFVLWLIAVIIVVVFFVLNLIL